MTNKESFYHPELDCLRFMAFLMVFWYHGVPATPHIYQRLGFPAAMVTGITGALTAGAYGVDLFFALSSYLITELLLREYRATGAIDVKAFYARRILRIWPLYFFVLMIGPWLLHRLDPNQSFSWRYTLAFLFFAGNWACALWGFPRSGMGPLWSVSIEEQFYILWPLVLRHFIRYLRPICFSLIGLAWAVRVWLLYIHATHPATWCDTLARLDPIAEGALVASFLSGRVPALRKATRLALYAAGAGILVAVGAFCDYNGPSTLVGYPAAAAASVALILATLKPMTGLPVRGLQRVPVHLGRISYGLYVFHDAAIHFTTVLSSSVVVWAVAIVKGFALTFALATISYYLLEKPFLKLKKRFTYIVSEPAAKVAMPPAAIEQSAI